MPVGAGGVFLVIVEFIVVGILIVDIRQSPAEFIFIIQAIAIAVDAGGIVDQRVGAVSVFGDVVPCVVIGFL